MAQDAGILSSIDASFNRSLEGLRVCEDICRFVLKNGDMALRLKELRHGIASLCGSFPSPMLPRARDVQADPIRFTDLPGEKIRDSLPDLFSRNIHRAVEALRSLEEFVKLLSIDSAGYQSLRFSLYEIERDVLLVLARSAVMEQFSNALYAICDPGFAGENLMRAAVNLIEGGASIIQLRMKNSPGEEFLRHAKEISALCKSRGTIFIVNDRPDIALISGAHGVHLGQDDLPVRDARRILPPDMIIGISTHSEEQARRAMDDGPDYIAIGPVYDTVSKNGELMTGIGVDVAARVASAVTVPVVAIGGIQPDRVAELEAAGVRCPAVMSALFKGDTRARCAEFLEQLNRGDGLKDEEINE